MIKFRRWLIIFSFGKRNQNDTPLWGLIASFFWKILPRPFRAGVEIFQKTRRAWTCYCRFDFRSFGKNDTAPDRRAMRATPQRGDRGEKGSWEPVKPHQKLFEGCVGVVAIATCPQTSSFGGMAKGKPTLRANILSSRPLNERRKTGLGLCGWALILCISQAIAEPCVLPCLIYVSEIKRSVSQKPCACVPMEAVLFQHGWNDGIKGSQIPSYSNLSRKHESKCGWVKSIAAIFHNVPIIYPKGAWPKVI